jgi:hypothetical protein
LLGDSPQNHIHERIHIVSIDYSVDAVPFDIYIRVAFGSEGQVLIDFMSMMPWTVLYFEEMNDLQLDDSFERAWLHLKTRSTIDDMMIPGNLTE